MEYGNDPSVDAAAAKLLGRFTAPQAEGEPEKKQPVKAPDQEVELPGDDVDVDGYKPDEALPEGADAQETEAEGDEAQRSQEEFFELPSETEGAEAERIPRAEAIEAVRQMRQLNGDVASAVIRAEEETYAKHDQVTQALASTFQRVEEQADLAMRMLNAFLPQMPDPIMLEEGAYYDPAGYWKARNYYDEFMAHRAKVAGTLKQARDALTATNGQQDEELVRRETERTARFIPEWKDEKSRAAKQEEIVSVLGPKYGIKMDDVKEITDHRALRIINDFAQLVKQAKAAPDVRKQVQEKAVKLTPKGDLPPRDKNNGQFVSEAKKRLQAEGSEAAFANKLLASGFIR